MLCFECENIRGILEIRLISWKAMRIYTRVVHHKITHSLVFSLSPLIISAFHVLSLSLTPSLFYHSDISPPPPLSLYLSSHSLISLTLSLFLSIAPPSLPLSYLLPSPASPSLPPPALSLPPSLPRPSLPRPSLPPSSLPRPSLVPPFLPLLSPSPPPSLSYLLPSPSLPLLSPSLPPSLPPSPISLPPSLSYILPPPSLPLPISFPPRLSPSPLSEYGKT